MQWVVVRQVVLTVRALQAMQREMVLLAVPMVGCCR